MDGHFLETAMALLSVNDASKVAGVSKSLVYELCRSGQLIHYRVGQKGKRGKVLVDTDDLRLFLKTCRVVEERIEEQPLKHLK